MTLQGHFTIAIHISYIIRSNTVAAQTLNIRTETQRTASRVFSVLMYTLYIKDGVAQLLRPAVDL